MSVPLVSIWMCTFPLGVVPVGLGDGVGHCRDAANFPENGPFISLGFFLGDETMPFKKGSGFYDVLIAGYASS